MGHIPRALAVFGSVALMGCGGANVTSADMVAADSGLSRIDAAEASASPPDPAIDAAADASSDAARPTDAAPNDVASEPVADAGADGPVQEIDAAVEAADPVSQCLATCCGCCEADGTCAPYGVGSPVPQDDAGTYIQPCGPVGTKCGECVSTSTYPYQCYVGDYNVRSLPPGCQPITTSGANAYGGVCGPI